MDESDATSLAQPGRSPNGPAAAPHGLTRRLSSLCSARTRCRRRCFATSRKFHYDSRIVVESYQLLTDWVAEPETGGASRHEVRRQLDLVATVGARPSHERLALRVPDEANRRVSERLKAMGIAKGTPWAVIHPGRSAPSRRYAPERFAEAAHGLVTTAGFRVIFTGDTSERPLIESIRAAMNAPSDSLAGELTLADLAAPIERAPLLIANNTGPVHIAAAVGTPVVDLYA